MVRRFVALLVAITAVIWWTAPIELRFESASTLRAQLEEDAPKQVSKTEIRRVRVSPAPLVARLPPLAAHGAEPGCAHAVIGGGVGESVWLRDRREFAKRVCPWLDASAGDSGTERA
jgi:hypothetical protein